MGRCLALSTTPLFVMGSVLSRSGTGSPQSSPAAFKVPGSTCYQMLTQHVTPTRSRVWLADMSRPSSRAAGCVWTWRCGDRTVVPVSGASLPATSATPGCSRPSANQMWDKQTPRPWIGRPEWGRSVLLLLPNLKAAVVHAGRSIDDGLEWPQPRLFLILPMLGSTPAGPGQVMDQRRMP